MCSSACTLVHISVGVFCVATKQLYMMVCCSVSWSVTPLLFGLQLVQGATYAVYTALFKIAIAFSVGIGAPAVLGESAFALLYDVYASILTFEKIK